MLDSGRWGDGRNPGGVEVTVDGIDFCLEE